MSTWPGSRNEGLKINVGRLFTKDEKSSIVITKAVAQVFDSAPEDMLGQTVSLTLFQSDASGKSQKSSTFALPDTYTIVGVVEGEENLVYLSLDSLGEFPLVSYTKLKVKCSSTDTINSVRAEIEGKGFIASSISETVDQANKVFRAVQIVLMVFGLIALIVSAIGMFNTMTIALLERTEEIGIMKSIGAAKRSIALMFLTESTLMGLLGALGGVVLGMLEGEVLNLMINLIAQRFGGESVDLFYHHRHSFRSRRRFLDRCLPGPQSFQYRRSRSAPLQIAEESLHHTKKRKAWEFPCLFGYVIRIASRRAARCCLRALASRSRSLLRNRMKNSSRSD